MRTLDNFQKSNNRISLVGLSESVQDKIKNLGGYTINECCCGCKQKCCCGEALPNPGTESITFFCSEQDIIGFLKYKPTVQGMFNLGNQFGERFRFHNKDCHYQSNPIYLKEYPCMENPRLTKPLTSMDCFSIQGNPEFYEFLTNLCDENHFTVPVVLEYKDHSIQVFLVSYGSDEIDSKNIKPSLIKMVQLMNELENENDCIEWTQILDVSIDNIDNQYAFLLTFSVDKSYFE